MRFLTHGTFAIMVLLGAIDVVSGQTSAQLRAKYGAPQMIELKENLPVVERFLVRPNIQMTIRYTTNGEPCEAVLEPVPNSTPKTGRPEYALKGDYMSTAEVKKLIDEILPIEKRGKKLSEGKFNGGDPEMTLHHPGCTGLYHVSFEHARIHAVSWCRGGTTSATIHWGKTSCPGQTIVFKTVTPPGQL
jgi:hypothetical protein